MTHPQWFQEKFPAYAATLQMHEQNSIAVSALDALIPQRAYLWTQQAWDAATENARCHYRR